MEKIIKIPTEICSVIYITEHKELHDKRLYLDDSGVARFILGTKNKDITVRDGVIDINWLDIERGITLYPWGNNNYMVIKVFNGKDVYEEALAATFEKVQLTYKD